MKVITIGRSRENNNIKIDDEKVSRNHLQIVQDDNGNYTVMDLGSTNGTFVNGQRIQRSAQLNPGDILKIGNSTLPWQSYFSSEGGAGIPNPPSIHNDKDNQDINDPIPFYRRWWTWIAVVVILLIIIGGVVWSAGPSDSKTEISESPVEQPEPSDPETEYYKAQTEYAEAQSEADRAAKEVAEKQAAVDRAQAEADRAAKHAAETKSKEDQKKAEAKAREAEKAKVAMEEAKENARKAKEDADAKKEAMITLQKELEKTKTELENTQVELKNTKEELLKAQRESRKRLFNSYLKQMKGHEDDFCQKQGWDKSGGAKKTIENNYKNASDADQQRIIDAMEAYANTIESANVEKPQTAGKGTAESDTTK